MPVSDWKVQGDRLLLRVIKPTDDSGLTRPDQSEDPEAPQTTLAEVVAKGPVVDQYAVGQHVIVLKTWARVEIEGDEFIVCDVSDDVLLARDKSLGYCADHPMHTYGDCPHSTDDCNCKEPA